MRRTIIGVIVFGVLVTFAAREVSAIPPFARKYGTSCSTCHVAIPKLNAYGDAFRRNGYALPAADKAFIKEKPVALGAKAWEQLWPKAIWPGEITGSVPFGAYMHQRLVWQFSEDDNKDTVFFDAPHELELLMGANLKGISFFGEWVFYEKEKNAAGLKRLFMQFNDVLGKHGLGENTLNIKLGRIEVGTMGGYKDGTKRLTMEHPITGDLRALENTGLAGWDTGYRWRMRDQQSGLEFNGILGHYFEYAVGVVNGEKSTVSEGKGSNSTNKDLFARIAYKFGGMGFDGHGTGEGLNETENWRDDSFTIGVYTYSGTTLKAGTSPSPSTENEFDRVGIDLRWQAGAFDLLAGYLAGSDGLDGTIGSDDVDSAAWFIEPTYRFMPWLIGLIRFEQFSVDCAGGGYDSVTAACAAGGTGILKEGTRINPHLLVLLRPNIRFGVEYLYEDRDWWKGHQPSPGTDDAKSSKWVKFNFQLVF